MKTNATRIRWAIPIAALLLAASAVAYGPDGRNGPRGDFRGPPDAETQLARMTQMLDLTDEQSARLLVVLQEAEAEREILHEQVMEQMKPQFCELQLSTESQVAEILTEEQLAQLDELRDRRSERRHEGNRHARDRLDCSAYE